MKKPLLISLLILLTFSYARAQRDQIKFAIEQQVETYPVSTLKDIYKNFFQDAFGPGHLVSNSPDSEQRIKNYLEQECKEAKDDPNICPDYELTGIHGRFYRVNLSVINDGRVPLKIFFNAFMKSANQFSLPKVEDWKKEWIFIEQCIKELGYRFPDQQQDSAAIMNILDQGQYASHHSIAYNDAYHPHYRLIEKRIFEEEILPLLKFDIYLMIGQSNCAGRGYMLERDTTEIIPGVWLLNSEGIPEPAKAPFNRYSNIRKDISMQMIGPAFSFAPMMHEKTGRNILIIQNAKGGSGLGEWQNEDLSSITFLDSTLMRAIPALKYGELRGIVWHQGETDTSNGTAGDIYVSRFKKMISHLRNAMNVREDVPVIVGELGQWEWEKKELIDDFNNVTLSRLVEVVPNCHKVESDCLECRSIDHNDPHFSRASNIELGRRYAEAMINAFKASKYRTQEYRQLQQRLCTGWNTWYNNSLVTHVCLPESFAINLCLATDDNRTYLKDVFKAADISNRPERVFPGLRADDGSYTSLRLQYRDIEINVESASDGEDELILVTPVKPSKHHLVVEAGLLYGKEGMIGQTKTQIKAQCQGREFVVNATAEPLPTSYLSTTSPRLAYSLMEPVGVYTGRQRSIKEIQEIIAQARTRQEERVAQYGELAESFLPMQTILAWNTIFDEPNHRAITPVSRNWNQNWGGYVLFDWDTYFASYMFSLFNKDLAFANAIEITKAITPDGFIPNFQSESSYVIDGNKSSWDRSQPPVGSEIIWRIYQRYPEKWFLEEVYDELLSWNRWWIENRKIGGYLAWGSHFVRDGKDITEGLQGAMYESGLDNSPMYDDVPMNPSTFTMELADVGLNSMYIMDCKALAKIANVLGKKEDVKELNARAKQFTKQLAKLWDEETGIFLNKRTDTGELSHRISPTNLYPMLAGACTQKQAERMMKDNYFNSEIFHGEYVLPTIARNDPAYGDNDYWRGRIWGPINFLVYLGMQQYDVKEARQDLINRSKALLMKNWQANGGIFENYNSRTGQGDDVHNADGFYHWGALLTFMEFLENGM